MDENGVAGADPNGVEGVDCSSADQKEAGCLFPADACGLRGHRGDLHDYLFGVEAVAGADDHFVADVHICDAVADSRDDARCLAAEADGKFLGVGAESAAVELEVEGIDADRLHVDQDFT